MRTDVLRPGHPLWTRAGDLAGPAIAWAVWGALTVGLILFVRQYTRNVPYWDDFELVPMMTGQEPVSLGWAWAQHNEHRPVLSRLILAGLSRFVANDFRTGKFFSVGLLSAAAASMLLLARRLRGSTRVTDAVLPLSILNIGQGETLAITFAMNLALTAWVAFELIATTGLAGGRLGWPMALRAGLLLVLLPLCGGSGLVLLPPLVLWLAGYVAWAWWSDREPGGPARAIGLGSLMACSAIAALYFSGYVPPVVHPPAPSIRAAASTMLECLSLALWPNVPRYWWPAGLVLVVLVAATLRLLVQAAIRAPGERPRALGLIAIILAMLGMAAAVGLARSGLGPGMGLSTRYVTLTAPLLGALYVAWLVYGPPRARRLVHAGLLASVCLALPANVKAGLKYGASVRTSERGVERSLQARVPVSELIRHYGPFIHPHAGRVSECFQMLKTARFGAFASLNDDRLTVSPASPAAVRR